MAQTLATYFENERKKVVSQCTQCGTCIEECPIVRHTDLKDTPPREIQEKVIGFLNDGAGDNVVYTKAFACMRPRAVSGRSQSLDDQRNNQIRLQAAQPDADSVHRSPGPFGQATRSLQHPGFRQGLREDLRSA